jgi:hypothetical protein
MSRMKEIGCGCVETCGDSVLPAGETDRVPSVPAGGDFFDGTLIGELLGGADAPPSKQE